MPISELKIEKKMPLPDYEYPLHKYVKDIYAKRIKCAHNTANNPQYPRKTDQKPSANRVQFTIFGNRFSKEFIQTVQVAQGLHKYRWKMFDVPLIRGVTGVEWPKVWTDLKIQYGGIVHCIQNPVVVLQNGNLLGGTEEFNEFVFTKYYYQLKLNLPKLSEDEFVKYVKSSSRPCAYMHISINNMHIGSLIFMLYADIVPRTCENFLRLCNEKKGGYSGTPVHRIVQDCWIQCGGFGLKSTDLDCENFCVPHDRRGVLCMANDGRHIDCSTQFFVLLEPAPWMADKYVAFGQLIDGAETLKLIESVPTWYESPTKNIIITDSGVLNLECQDIDINKGTTEYLESHVEDLIALGDWLIEGVMERFFLELEFQHVTKLEAQGEGPSDEDQTAGIRGTARFLRKKEDLNKPSEINQEESLREVENNDFDVEEYSYEPEEDRYHHVSVAETPSIVVKPTKPYYLTFTDVPYPGEIDSTHDLKKFLKGHYCIESDLIPADKEIRKHHPKNLRMSYHSDIRNDSPPMESIGSLDSDDEREIKNYLKYNVDRLSFAGGVVRNIARGYANTNFYEGIRNERKVRIASSATVQESSSHPLRRPTGFVRPAAAKDSDVRPSVLARLYEDLACSNHEFGPTLKDYKSFAETRKKNMFLTVSPTARIKNVANEDKYFRRPSVIEDQSYEQIMNMQHGKKFARKISSDYVTTIDQVERKTKNSLRSIEFAKTRPTLTVSEYQRRKLILKPNIKSISGRDNGKDKYKHF